MNLSSTPPPHPSRALMLAATQRYLQPDSRAGTVYDRAERRRPNDRRQQERPVYFDMRANRGERRRERRRAVYDPGRRRLPEPPMGIDVWA